MVGRTNPKKRQLRRSRALAVERARRIAQAAEPGGAKHGHLALANAPSFRRLRCIAVTVTNCASTVFGGRVGGYHKTQRASLRESDFHTSSGYARRSSIGRRT